MRAVRLHGIGDLRVEEVPFTAGARRRRSAAARAGGRYLRLRSAQLQDRPVDRAAAGDAGARVRRRGPRGRRWRERAQARRSGGRRLAGTLRPLFPVPGAVVPICASRSAMSVKSATAASPRRSFCRPAACCPSMPALAPEVAALAEPLAVALHAIRRLGRAHGRAHPGGRRRPGRRAHLPRPRSFRLCAGAVRGAADGAAPARRRSDQRDAGRA